MFLITKCKLIDFSTAYHWDSSSAAKFQDTLCHPICKKSINEKNLDGVNDDPDNPTSEIVNILDRAALSAKKQQTNKQNNLRKKQIIVSGLTMI